MMRSELACLALSVLLASCGGAWALAQSAETEHRFDTEPHVGPPREALVGITVTNYAQDGTAQVRHGNGIFIRCDGFVLAPDDLFSLQNSPKDKIDKPNQVITVVLHPGTPSEKKLPAARPRGYGIVESGDRWLRLRYTVLKLDDIHQPAPRLLAPDAISPGDGLQVLSSAWSDSAGRFEAPQLIEERVGPRRAPAKTDKDGAAVIPRFAAQLTPFADSQPAVPDGAIVIGPDSLLVGMVTKTDASGFSNFGSMDAVTNAVGVLPSTDVQFDAFLKKLDQRNQQLAAEQDKPAPGAGANAKSPEEPQPLRAHSEMVNVAGGLLKIPTVIKTYEQDMANVYSACIPPFKIDKYEVTNAQYLEFWKSLPADDRKNNSVRAEMYPYGWGAENSPFPQDMAQNPVLGVRLEGAKAFAKWAGKRLPTPYEWSLAAFGRHGGNQPPLWGDKYMQAREAAWKQIVQAHIEYAHQHPEIVPGFITHVGITGAVNTEVDWSRPVVEEFCQLPWFFMRPGFAEAAAWSHACVRRITEQLFKDWVDPGYVLAVGSRPYDVSPCGAMDMIMNARELVLPGPHGAWTRLPNDHWPYSRVDRYMEVDWVQQGLINRRWFRTGEGVLDLGIPGSATNPIFAGNGVGLVDIDSFLKTAPMFNNNLLIAHPVHNEPGNIATVIMNPGLPFTDSALPFSSIDQPVPAEADSALLNLCHPVSSYQYRMPSRRIRSASQNAIGAEFVPADLGDYVAACSAVQEYSEQLRPVDTCMLNLAPGPTFNVPYWASTGTWGAGDAFLISGGSSVRRIGRILVRQNAIGDTGLNEWTADATCISFTGAFATWAGGPDHYHAEMGRPTAVDAKYPINSRGNTANRGAFAPDTYLIPGGFRCAR